MEQAAPNIGSGTGTEQALTPYTAQNTPLHNHPTAQNAPQQQVQLSQEHWHWRRKALVLQPHTIRNVPLRNHTTNRAAKDSMILSEEGLRMGKEQVDDVFALFSGTRGRTLSLTLHEYRYRIMARYRVSTFCTSQGVPERKAFPWGIIKVYPCGKPSPVGTSKMGRTKKFPWGN